MDLFRQGYEEILKIHSGITDLASIEYHDEGSTSRTIQEPSPIRLGRGD